MVSCKKNQQIIVNNSYSLIDYCNIDSTDEIPVSFVRNFESRVIQNFDALQISKRTDLVRLTGVDSIYVLQHLYSIGLESNSGWTIENIKREENRFFQNSTLYSAGCFEVNKGINSFVVLLDFKDEVTNSIGLHLYLLNAKNGSLRSIIEISDFIKGTKSSLYKKTYRLNHQFFITDLRLRDRDVNLTIHDVIQKKLKISSEQIKVLDYAKFVIEDGKIDFKVI